MSRLVKILNAKHKYSAIKRILTQFCFVPACKPRGKSLVLLGGSCVNHSWLASHDHRVYADAKKSFLFYFLHCSHLESAEYQRLFIEYESIAAKRVILFFLIKYSNSASSEFLKSLVSH